jgi:hypothetical protein
LLLPIAIKLIHAITYHSATEDCKIDRVHLHALNQHNEALDYFFQPLAQNIEVVEFTLEPSSISTIPTLYSVHLFSFYQKGKSSRAPPVFVF